MAATTSSYSITMRLHTAPDHGIVGAVATAISHAGGIVTALLTSPQSSLGIGWVFWAAVPFVILAAANREVNLTFAAERENGGAQHADLRVAARLPAP